MAVKAKRGQWLAVESAERSYYIGQANTERIRVDLFEVTSCTRDGFVKECRTAQGDPSGARWASGRALVISADVVASDDVRRVAMAQHYDGYPNQLRAFDSLDELRDALRPYRVANPKDSSS